MIRFFETLRGVILMSAIAAAILGVPQVVMAQNTGLVPCGNGSYSYDATQPGAQPPANTGATEQQCTVDDLFRIVVIVANFLIGFAGLVAVFMIVRGGFNLITSAGNTSAYAAAKKTVTYAIGGFVLTFLAFLLVNSLLSAQLGIGIKGGGNIFTNTIKFIQGKP